jgi:hypothetical protein
MKNAIVKLGFCLLFFCVARTAYATPPTVTVTPVTSSPTNSTTVNFTVTFSASVNGFDKNDITLGGAAAGGLALSNITVTPASPAAVYNVQITGLTVDGSLDVSIPGGAATEVASPFDGSVAGGPGSITFDGTKPRPLITQPGQSDPTTGGTQIKFTVTWTEPISSFPNSAISFAGSGTGASTLSINSITEIAPMNKTKYEVFVDVDAPNATGNQHVIMTILANGVTDPAGNLNLIDNPTGRDNDVVYAGVAPTIASPPTAVPTEDGFIISGNVTFDGGLSTAQRGFVWKNSSPVGSGDHKTQVGTGEGSFTGSAVTGLNDETQYFYRTWVDNGIGSLVLSSEQSIYTLSQAPANNDNVTATAKGTGQIDLSFTKFQTNSRADGMIVLRKQGSAPVDNDLKDGQTPVVGNMPLLIAVITDNQATTYSDQDPTLLPGTTYYYAVVPFSWDQGTPNPATYNYKEGFSTDNATTFSKSSIIAYTGTPTQLDYASFTTTDFTSASDGVSIASFTLHDGDNVTDDADGLYTELKSITITVSNPSMIRRIAVNDGGTMHGEQNMDPSGTVTFSIPAGQILTKDNNATGGGSPDQFDIIASFDPAQINADQTPVTVTITAATTYATGGTPSGSEFVASDAGGATTGTDYVINVIATKTVFSGITNPINPNSDFSLTVTVKDTNDKIDTNGGGSITLSMTAGTGTFASTDTPGGLTRTLVNGTTTWDHLKFSTALNKTIKADHSGSVPDKTVDVTVISLGANVQPKNLPGANFATLCFNTAAGGFQTIAPLATNPITITESDGSDFSAGTDLTYSIMLPPGFVFNTAGGLPSVTFSGTDIAAASTLIHAYVGNNILRIAFNVNGTGGAVVDQIKIANLQVKYIGTTPVANQPILRVGGSSVQAGNADSNAQPHGYLSGGPGSIGVDFQNTNGGSIQPNQTSFSHVSDPPIVLQGIKTSDSSPITGPTAVFAGEGVVYDGSNYKFYPTQVNNGNHDITFTYTYTDPSTSVAGCISNVTKTFNVFSSIITNLNASYCINDNASTLGAPTGIAPSGTCVDGLLNVITAYDNAHVVYKYFDGSSWVNLPVQNTFNPGDPLFTPVIPIYGGVYISVWYVNQCTGTELGWVSALIRIIQKPVIDFSPTFPDGVCSTDPIVDMTSAQFDDAGAFDEFWTSTPGNASSAVAGITGDRASGFKFDPALANPSPANSNVSLQINYKHRDPSTGCTNQIAQTVSVWRKPPQVPASLIQIKGATDTSGEFCQVGDPISAFSLVPPNATMFYRWYDAAGTSEVTTSGKTSFNAVVNVPTSGGLPVVALYTFNVTQTENRVPGFVGCESSLRPITVEVFAPTLITAGTPTTICEGNDVILSTLNASITPPSGTLDGQWSSTHAFPGTFSPNSTFSTATHYTPSAQEIADGQITLRLRSNDPPGPCGFVESFVTIRINPGITVTFPITPVEYCASATDMLVEGKVSSPTLGFQWSVIGGGGSLDPGSDVKTTTKYIPSFTELNEGADVQLTLTTDDPDGPGGPCVVVSNTVHLLISQRPKVIAGPDFEICADQTINVTSRIPPTGNPVGDLTKSSATSVTWTHTGLGNLTDPTALATTYNPDPTEQATSTSIIFTALSNTPGGANICPAERDEVIITLHPRPVAPTPITPPNYCIGDVVDLLNVVGTFPSWYNNADLDPTHRISSGNNQLSTAVVANAEKRVPFWVTQTTDKTPAFAGCESASVKMVVVVNPLPVPAFMFANQCLGDIMKFTNGSTLAQPVDPLEPSRSIVGYQWNFADNLGSTTFGTGTIPATDTQGGSTSGTYEDPGHKFKDAGDYAVRLTLRTSDGCSASFTNAPIKVGPIPVANFSIAKLCDDDNTQFTSSTGLDPSVSTTYSWDFGDAASGATNLSAAVNPAHNFSAVGTYDVSLTVTTDLNCTNSIIKKASIFPYIKTFPYVENFESAGHGWVPEGLVVNGANTVSETSWNLLTSAGSITSDPDNAAGSKFWATHTNVTPSTFYYDNERSILYGPCVDMTALQRPVLAFDYFNDTEDKGDGVYIEYIDESSASPVWTRLGDNNGGLNWYNESSIGGLSQLNGIGQNVSQFGWSGSTTNWTTGRYNLDAFAGKTRLRFRVVFGSNFSPVSTDAYDGFALDYFRLESRNRVVLVENFTSQSSSPVFATNRDAFKAFPSASASSEVVKIEYHTALPVVAGDPTDPIFTQNPMDPNARASFYGLSAVPRGYIDGYTNLSGNGMFNGTWAATYYSTESLKTSPLNIAFNTTTIINGTLHVTGTITATDIDLQANKYSLYLAIVEEAVNNDSYVLRKMLPSASGRKVPLTVKGGSFTFDETWTIDRTYLGNTPQLVAVAFIQSDIVKPESGERAVLQAAYKVMPPIDNFTTGVEVPFLDQTAIYPNPADHIVNIALPQATSTGVEVKVIDQLGRPVIQSQIAAGQSSVSIDTGGLAGTVYIVQLKENGVYTTRRLLVTHKY